MRPISKESSNSAGSHLTLQIPFGMNFMIVGCASFLLPAQVFTQSGDLGDRDVGTGERLVKYIDFEDAFPWEMTRWRIC